MSDLASLELDELEEELATLAAHLSAGTCRWLELVAELDRRGGFAADGHASCAGWLAWRCALTPRAAREHVRVARSLAGLPRTQAAFARGELSYAKVRALTRVASAGDEEQLLDLARGLTASQLERAVRAYRRVSIAEAREQLEAAYLSASWRPDGCLELHGRLAPEDGALLLRALEAIRDRAWKDSGSAEPRPARQVSPAEALVAVCDAALAHTDEGRPGGERYQVIVHTDEAALAHDDEGGSELEDGSAIASETARRLACDATLVRDGRRSRTIPASTRRALRTRDRGCRFPGCENRLFLDAHHIQHWAKGGETTLANLLLLCRHHHRAVHEGSYSVDDRGRFYHPWGQQLQPVPPAAARRPRPAGRPQLRARDRPAHLPARHRRPHGPRADSRRHPPNHRPRPTQLTVTAARRPRRAITGRGPHLGERNESRATDTDGHVPKRAILLRVQKRRQVRL